MYFLVKRYLYLFYLFVLCMCVIFEFVLLSCLIIRLLSQHISKQELNLTELK